MKNLLSRLGRLLAVAAILLSVSAAPALADSAPNVGRETSRSGPSTTPQQNSSDTTGAPAQPGGKDYADRDNYPIGAPEVTATPGGPQVGPASPTGVIGSGLPSEVESAWPNPGVDLVYPLHEARVTFKVEVDTRTFKGRVIDVETGETADAIDGAPALFVRSVETAVRGRDVIGTLGYLDQGSYRFEWEVKTLAGVTIKGTIPFTQNASPAASGGGNHRHNILELPGQDFLLGLARFLLILAVAFSAAWSTSRRWAKFSASASASLAGILYTTVFGLAAYQSELKVTELTARLDGWAAVGVLVAAICSMLARTRSELLFYTAAATFSAYATTYIPNLRFGLLQLGLAGGALVATGIYGAAAVGLTPTKLIRQILMAVYAALAPIIGVVLFTQTWNPSRGQGDDLRTKVYGAAAVFALVLINILIGKLNSPTLKNLRYVAVYVIFIAVTFTATAPALL